MLTMHLDYDIPLSILTRIGQMAQLTLKEIDHDTRICTNRICWISGCCNSERRLRKCKSTKTQKFR